MNMDTQLKQEMDTMAATLHDAQMLYYNEHQSPMSDEAYDKLFARLQKLEEETGYVPLASPTNRVGVDADNAFKKVKHGAPILSLANSFSLQAIKDWHDKNVKRAYENGVNHVVAGRVGPDTQITIEPKLDGLSLVVRYENGVLAQAVTRGDGKVGDDVTENARTIKNLPVVLTTDDERAHPVPKSLVVRGEVVITNDDFEAFNKAEGDVYSNPRNLASGSLKQKRSEEAARRPLRFIVFDILKPWYDTRTQIYVALTRWNFTVVPQHLITMDYLDQDVLDTWAQLRENMQYNTDGIVIKYNNQYLTMHLGVHGKDPYGAIAYKYQEQSEVTRLTGVSINVTRTGKLQPVGQVEPVQIGGVTVQNVTLNNFGWIAERDLKIGDMVLIKRSGDVIPYLEEVFTGSRTGSESDIELPSSCPVCGNPTTYDGRHVWCKSPTCETKRLGRILHFVRTMEFDGISNSTIEQLYDAHIIRFLDDLFNLDYYEEDILALPGFGQSRMRKLDDGVHWSRTKPPTTVWKALGVEGAGERVGKKLIGAFGSIDNVVENVLCGIETGDFDQFLSIDGIGQSMVDTLAEWFSIPSNMKIIYLLREQGFRMNEGLETVGADTESPVAGKMFVITGTLPIKRSEAEAKIESLGGKTSGSVNSKTDYLITDDDPNGSRPSSKMKKALKLNIPIMTWEEFLDTVE